MRLHFGLTIEILFRNKSSDVRSMENFKVNPQILGIHCWRCSSQHFMFVYTQCLESVLDQLLPLHFFQWHTSTM